MEFKINTQKSINDIMRTIGYLPAYFQSAGEASIIRKVGGGDYPRFHLYIKENRTVEPSTGLCYIFSLHLDQKKPSYEGSRGHSGEYDGPVVEGEAERIKQLLSSSV